MVDLNINRKAAIEFNDTMNEFVPMFEDLIIERENKKSAVFLAIAVAFRIAAKLSTKFKINRETFLQLANQNFDFEDVN
jgi:hypothetical protein